MVADTDEIRKRLDRLIALEHQHQALRDTVNRHETKLVDMATRLGKVEQAGPLNALVQRWVIAGIGVIVMAVFTALVGLVVLPKMMTQLPHATPSAPAPASK